MPRRHTRKRGGKLDPEPDNDPAHNAAPVRRAQRLENERRRLAGIAVNNRQDADSGLSELSERLRHLREEPVPPMPSDVGGKRHRKTKKSTRRHRRR